MIAWWHMELLGHGQGPLAKLPLGNRSEIQMKINLSLIILKANFVTVHFYKTISYAAFERVYA